MKFDGTPAIKVLPNGPYRVTGQVALTRFRPVVDADGDKMDWERGPVLEHGETFDLCRCGRSASLPFCDGTEADGGFDGSETADRSPTAGRREWFGRGPVALSDDISLCSAAAFCHRGAIDVWGLAEEAPDRDAEGPMTSMVKRCPSGRLIAHLLPEGAPLEDRLEPEIGVIDDGPAWVRGGIPIEAGDGFRYEVRNRVTLCRCGRSRNKPFCDGSHQRAGFRDP